MDDTTRAASVAVVLTERPDRYAKQLVSHLTRRVEGEWHPERRAGWLGFPSGRASLQCEDGRLELRIDADREHLEELEDVVGRHLVRFGGKDELVVRWVRDGGAPGSEQRAT